MSYVCCEFVCVFIAVCHVFYCLVFVHVLSLITVLSTYITTHICTYNTSHYYTSDGQQYYNNILYFKLDLIWIENTDWLTDGRWWNHTFECLLINNLFRTTLLGCKFTDIFMVFAFVCSFLCFFLNILHFLFLSVQILYVIFWFLCFQVHVLPKNQFVRFFFQIPFIIIIRK